MAAVRRSFAPLFLLAGLAFLVGLGTPPLADADEAFYAEAAREMVESGDWLTPHYNYEPRFQKPVLYYWLSAAIFWLSGASTFAARLWAAISGVGLVFVTASLARRWYDDDTALMAGAIVATSFGYVALARMALPDLPLALSITATIAAALMAIGERVPRPRSWLLAASLSAALGFLLKGPLALVLPAVVLLPIKFIERRASRLRLADIGVAAAVFVAVASPWYLAMYLEHGAAYLQGFFIGDNLERFATDRFNEPRPWWYYGPVILGGVVPWAPYAFFGVGAALRAITGRGSLGSQETRLVMWIALPLLVLTVSVGKQPRYVLPILPPVAILIARAIVERTEARRGLDGGLYRQRPNRAMQAASLAAGAIWVVTAALVWRAASLFVDVPRWQSTTAAAVVGLAGALVVAVSVSRSWRTAPWVLAWGSAVALPALVLGVLGGGSEDAVRRVAKAVTEARRSSEPIGVSRVFVRNLVFYTGVKQTDLINDEQLAAFLAQPSPALVVVPAEVLERVEAAGARRADRVAEFQYLNEAGLRLRSFLSPDPARDNQRVLLVRTRGASSSGTF